MTKPNPQVVFEHALSFLVADGILRTKAKDDEKAAFYIQHPGMICSAFCSELLLKCLLLLEGKTPPNKHDLKVLYDLLELTGESGSRSCGMPMLESERMGLGMQNGG